MRNILMTILYLLFVFCSAGFAQQQPDSRIIYRNLALHSEVTVSSVGEAGLAGTNAVDGDTLTRWTSDWKDNEWIQADLKKVYPLDRIILKWEVAYAKEYKVQVSTDGLQWTDVFTEMNSDGKTDIINLSSLQARYLKLLCIKRGTRFGSSLWEMEIYSYSYPIAFVDIFNNPALSGWSGSENYILSHEKNALRIERRPAISGMLSGDIIVTLPRPVQTTDFPFLSFRAKTGVRQRLIIQLEYSDGMKTTLTGLLKPDDRWHICSYALDPALHQPLKELRLQVMSAAPDKDTVMLYLDDLAIGYQGKIQDTDLYLLRKLVSKAEAYFRSSTHKDCGRTIAENALSQYQNEIDAAKAILKTNDLAQIDIDNAVNRLMAANAAVEGSVILPAMPVKTCNPGATAETQYLYNNLKFMEGKSIFFGQMDPFYLNGKPSGKQFQSDIEDICGSLPAVGNWDLKDIVVGLSDTFTCKEVEYYYNKNGIVSFCWHMMDPSGSGFYIKDIPDPQVGNQLLPGGKYHEWYLEQLDRAAFFFQQLKGEKGESVPILFRPFHEMDGDWFWWGKPNVSNKTFILLWRYTYDYLVKEKKVNNLLFVFSPCDRFTKRDGEMGYLDYYPGDDCVDVLAQDNYWQVRSGADSATFVNQLQIMVKLAAEKNKIAAVSETGLDGIGIHDWFTSVLLKPVKNDSLARRISYISIWNRSFVPYPGHPAAPDFLKFFRDPFTLFIGDYPDLYHGLINH